MRWKLTDFEINFWEVVKVGGVVNWLDLQAKSNVILSSSVAVFCVYLYIINSNCFQWLLKFKGVSHHFHLNGNGCRSLSYVRPVNTLEKYDDSDKCPIQNRHDVDSGDDDDEEEEDGVITLNHGIVWISSRLRILWSISLQNLVVVIINNHHCLQFFRRGELKKFLWYSLHS